MRLLALLPLFGLARASIVEEVASKPAAELRKRLATASAEELMAKSSSGQTVAHVLVASLYSGKAGDISRLEPWSHPGTETRYRHAITNRLAQPMLPMLAAVLKTQPALARAADAHGVTPLHLAALLGVQGAARLLLDAGASPLAATDVGISALREAMLMGQVEILAMMMRALPEEERERRSREAARYASLPGSPLLPSALKEAGLPSLPRARPRVDPPPRGAQEGASCGEGGGWDALRYLPEDVRSRCEIDQRDGSTLSEEEYFREYFSQARPVLLRDAIPLKQRCGLAKGRGPMKAAETRKRRCGRTAYPSLTGQQFCGSFSYLDLNDHPACSDESHTLPVCVSKPNNAGGEGKINGSSSVWSKLPVNFRYGPEHAPLALLRRSWEAAGSRQLFAGGNGSGAALHFHNAAYNALFFGVKHWLITPPRWAGISGTASTYWRDVHAPRDMPAGLPVRCSQGPGGRVLSCVPH